MRASANSLSLFAVEPHRLVRPSEAPIFRSHNLTRLSLQLPLLQAPCCLFCRHWRISERGIHRSLHPHRLRTIAPAQASQVLRHGSLQWHLCALVDRCTSHHPRPRFVDLYRSAPPAKLTRLRSLRPTPCSSFILVPCRLLQRGRHLPRRWSARLLCRQGPQHELARQRQVRVWPLLDLRRVLGGQRPRG